MCSPPHKHPDLDMPRMLQPVEVIIPWTNTQASPDRGRALGKHHVNCSWSSNETRANGPRTRDSRLRVNTVLQMTLSIC